MRVSDWEALRRVGDSTAILLVNLSASDARQLHRIPVPNLRRLSLQHFKGLDLTFVQAFKELEFFEVCQSEQTISLDGIQALRRLRWLSISEVGPLLSLEPLAALEEIEDLFLTSGMWKTQRVLGDLKPLASLKNLRRLALTGAGPEDLSALLGFTRLEQLWVATALLPMREVARLAAAYPFWGKLRPWLRPPEGSGRQCSRCGGREALLLLRRTKRRWCESCDGGRGWRTSTN